MSARSLVVKVTAGRDDPERCNQAFTVAAAAAASGVPLSVWLTGEASWLALPDGCPDLGLPHSPALLRSWPRSWPTEPRRWCTNPAQLDVAASRSARSRRAQLSTASSSGDS